LAEDAPFRPANPYAASKAAADLALGEMALRGLRVIRLRPFNQVGAGQAPAFVLAAFARQVARIAAGLQPPLLRTGALDRWRDFLDVRDVARGYALALVRAGELAPGTASALAPGTALNLASGTPRRVGDMLADLCALAGITPAIETDPDRLRPTDVVSTSGDAAAARAALGWAPAIPWEATLASILADWQDRLRADPAA
jgi:GDP-4-dehydro-6-deoxy-D-mannose reductase